VTAGTATILSTDVVGSTELRARLGDVEADLLQRRHDDLLRSAVERRGGSVVKGLGDGILASFGAAAEAVLAARDIQRDVDRANRQAREDQRLAVRVGLSAGDVSWDDGDCYGTPVITASRLCDAADGGQILCDDLVRGLARGRTELSFALVGETTLKGLPVPVVVFEVPWVATATSLAPLPAPLRRQAGELPFAAREDERRHLAESWKRAQAEGATIVLLAGEPGIGKTRLASELARDVHAEGALVVLGRCDEHVAAPYGPWLEAVRTLVTAAADEVLLEHVARHGGELARLVPDLTRRVPDAPTPTAADPETERLLLFDAVVDLVTVMTFGQPLLLVIDDAHWADAGSVHLLRHAVGRVDPDARMLLLVTYRDTDVDRAHALAAALADLSRSARAERVLLRGFDEEGLRAFLEHAGGHPLEAEGFELAHRLAAETDGNPFFVTEVLRHLVETGAIVQRDGVWTASEQRGTPGLPEGVRDVIGQRLSRLDPTTNDVLRTAAVVGREFDVGVVARVLELEDDVAVDAFEPAVAARLVDEVEEHAGLLSFGHALVRQTLLEELSTNKRVRLHRKIAELLDGRPGTPIGVLAHHYLEAAVAGVAERAVEVACEAASAARNRFAWQDAVSLYERALEAIDVFDRDDPSLRSSILSSIAHSYHGAGDASRARQTALRAADVARRAGDAAGVAVAGTAYQGELGMWSRPADPVAAEIMREGLDALGTEHPAIRARVQTALAHGLLLTPGDAPLAEAEKAVGAARAAGDGEALQYALMVRAWAVRGARPAAERQRAAEDAIAAAVAGNDRYHELAASYHLGNALLTQGDLDGAAAAFETTSEFAGSLEGWAIADFRASLALAHGRFDEAEELADAAHVLGSALGDTNDGIHSFQRWWSALQRGDRDAALRWRAVNVETAIGATFPSEALLSLVLGDPERARLERDAWHARAPGMSEIVRYIVLHPASLLAFGLDDLDHLEELAAHAERFAGELLGSDASILGASDAARGRFTAVRGDLDGAVPLLEAGHAMHVRLGLEALQVDTAVDLGSVLLRRDAPGDAARAGALLAEGAELATRLGMAPRAAQARALLG
jgi:class 3 adenylate cyclase